MTLAPARSITVDRLIKREMATEDGKRRRLAKTVQRWYGRYTPHSAEEQVDASQQSIPKATFG
jgi:hypothetical protein